MTTSSCGVVSLRPYDQARVDVGGTRGRIRVDDRRSVWQELPRIGTSGHPIDDDIDASAIDHGAVE
jgi:hypothetical protein